MRQEQTAKTAPTSQQGHFHRHRPAPLPRKPQPQGTVICHDAAWTTGTAVSDTHTHTRVVVNLVHTTDVTVPLTPAPSTCRHDGPSPQPRTSVNLWCTNGRWWRWPRGASTSRGTGSALPLQLVLRDRDLVQLPLQLLHDALNETVHADQLIAQDLVRYITSRISSMASVRHTAGASPSGCHREHDVLNSFHHTAHTGKARKRSHH